MSSLAYAVPHDEILGYQEAFVMADELDQIRLVYGDDCLTFVKKSLLLSGNPDWKGIVSGAVFSWQQGHPHMNLDDICI